MNPTPPAHCLRCSTSPYVGTGLLNDSTADRSSKAQVFPMENVLLMFSLPLCIRTCPDFRTAMIMTRGFLTSGFEFGGGGVDGYAASSIMRICVIYDSNTMIWS